MNLVGSLRSYKILAGLIVAHQHRPIYQMTEKGPQDLP